MKNIKSIITQRLTIVALAIILLLSSCSKKWLDLEPQDRVSEDAVWDNPSVADLFLNDIYGYLPPYRTTGWWSESWTDNAINTQTWQGQAEIVRSGAMSPSNTLFTIKRYDAVNDWHWDSNFVYIRKCNVFIQKVRESEGLTSEYKTARVAEAKFMRAWFYMTTFKYFGGLPLIDEPLDLKTQGDAIFRERATAQATVAFISKDCQEAADSLPVDQPEWGRITKGAALALKGYIELLGASPLSNPDGNTELWAKAAASYKQVIDMAKYQLTPYFHGLFIEDNNHNSEMILPYVIRYPLANEDQDVRFLEDLYGPANAIIQPFGVVNYSIVESTPTQDLVDAYRMKDGKTISESPLYDPAHPYANREPRFYESIIYDGAPFRDGFIYTRKGDPYNAVDRARTSWVTPTGYYIRKTYDERINGLLERPKGQKNHGDWPIIRYADVLLGYAEAQNEAVGPDASVLDAINQIRQRTEVSIPTIQDTYGAVTKEQMREIIRNERRIELAFEDKRYTDITRWKIGNKLQGFVRGVEPSLNTVTNQITYDYFNVVPQTYDVTNDKNYRLPIPLSTMEKNPKLVQNPGY
jgi:starch-binding outer membrane protein, SusD/RagB family